MNTKTFSIGLVFSLLLFACGGKEEKKEGFSVDRKKTTEKTVESTEPASEVPASQRITLDNKGVGPIKDLPLDPNIDQAMVDRGAALFKTNCNACHKVDKRFIGPSPKGIMERRSPEWIMNMILDPQLMVEEDRCAKDLLVEFNGAAMANQNMTEDQARDILEFFRTLN
ncbi:MULTISPECIES: c-type cytochrome [Maribacter]|uniref:Cytochrome c n=2 Tax=Maribacter TaxID=252356 RepID=A0A5R8M9K3_9FLAO|nr:MULTISPECIES: cytochrome c [Maribacter]KAA2219017.1 cytochrome c [Maribacter flavus]TLF46243.1 cytochrome c [Maribacter aurantiacus]